MGRRKNNPNLVEELIEGMVLCLSLLVSASLPSSAEGFITVSLIYLSILYVSQSPFNQQSLLLSR